MTTRNRSLLTLAMVLPAAGLALLVSSCKSIDANVSTDDINKVEEKMEGPSARATRYDTALTNLSLLLRACNCQSINIQPKPITNDTGGEGVPKDLVQMVTTALGKIGDPVKVIPYDPTYVFTEKELGQTLDRTIPNIIVTGAITEYDKDVFQEKREYKADGQFGKGTGETTIGGGYDADAGGGRIALDLRVVAYRTQQVITNAQTSNKIDIKKKSQGGNFNVAVYGNALGVNASVTRKEGAHAALRLLVETSILELVGKYFDVPYWRCVEGSQPDEALIGRYREALKDDPAGATIKMKVLAYTHGQDVSLDTADITDKDKQALEKLKAQYNVKDDYDLIVELWKNVPMKEGAERLKNYRKEMTKAQAAAEEAEQKAAAEKKKTETAAAPVAAAPAAKAPAAAGKAGGKFGKIDDKDF